MIFIGFKIKHHLKCFQITSKTTPFLIKNIFFYFLSGLFLENFWNFSRRFFSWLRHLARRRQPSSISPLRKQSRLFLFSECFSSSSSHFIPPLILNHFHSQPAAGTRFINNLFDDYHKDWIADLNTGGLSGWQFLGQSLRTMLGNLDTGATMSDVPIIINKSHFRKSIPIKSVKRSGRPLNTNFQRVIKTISWDTLPYLTEKCYIWFDPTIAIWFHFTFLWLPNFQSWRSISKRKLDRWPTFHDLWGVSILTAFWTLGSVIISVAINKFFVGQTGFSIEIVQVGCVTSK